MKCLLSNMMRIHTLLHCVILFTLATWALPIDRRVLANSGHSGVGNVLPQSAVWTEKSQPAAWTEDLLDGLARSPDDDHFLPQLAVSTRDSDLLVTLADAPEDSDLAQSPAWAQDLIAALAQSPEDAYNLEQWVRNMDPAEAEALETLYLEDSRADSTPSAPSKLNRRGWRSTLAHIWGKVKEKWNSFKDSFKKTWGSFKEAAGKIWDKVNPFSKTKTKVDKFSPTTSPYGSPNDAYGTPGDVDPYAKKAAGEAKQPVVDAKGDEGFVDPNNKILASAKEEKLTYFPAHPPKEPENAKHGGKQPESGAGSGQTKETSSEKPKEVIIGTTPEWARPPPNFDIDAPIPLHLDKVDIDRLEAQAEKILAAQREAEAKRLEAEREAEREAKRIAEANPPEDRGKARLATFRNNRKEMIKSLNQEEAQKAAADPSYKPVYLPEFDYPESPSPPSTPSTPSPVGPLYADPAHETGLDGSISEQGGRRPSTVTLAGSLREGNTDVEESDSSSSSLYDWVPPREHWPSREQGGPFIHPPDEKGKAPAPETPEEEHIPGLDKYIHEGPNRYGLKGKEWADHDFDKEPVVPGPPKLTTSRPPAKGKAPEQQKPPSGSGAGPSTVTTISPDNDPREPRPKERIYPGIKKALASIDDDFTKPGPHGEGNRAPAPNDVPPPQEKGKGKGLEQHKSMTDAEWAALPESEKKPKGYKGDMDKLYEWSDWAKKQPYGGPGHAISPILEEPESADETMQLQKDQMRFDELNDQDWGVHPPAAKLMPSPAKPVVIVHPEKQHESKYAVLNDPDWPTREQGGRRPESISTVSDEGHQQPPPANPKWVWVDHEGEGYWGDNKVYDGAGRRIHSSKHDFGHKFRGTLRKMFGIKHEHSSLQKANNKFNAKWAKERARLESELKSLPPSMTFGDKNDMKLHDIKEKLKAIPPHRYLGTGDPHRIVSQPTTHTPPPTP